RECRAQAVARSTGRSCSARAACQCRDVRSRGGRAAARRQRIRTQHLQDRSRTPLYRARAHTSRTRHATVAVLQENRLRAMAPYIGTSTSRVDGFTKVTGAAKYAAEFNVPGLAYGSVVTSTIAKGRILRIDPSAALRVKGVLDVLTHENRPPMADNDEAYKDEMAPAGSPLRPLYDSRIIFNGQPIALVVAETSEIARFAASLVRVEYEKDAHITDVYRRREAATPVKPPTNPLEALFTP